MKHTLTIAVPDDFDFRMTVESHGWYRLAPYAWDGERGVLRHVEALDDGSVIPLEISMQGHQLEVRHQSSERAARDELQRRVRRMFQLHVDIADFHRQCARRKSHRAIAAMKLGRLLCGSTFFEDAVKIITTTNTTWASTVKMNELLVEVAGRVVTAGERRTLKAFPGPHDIFRFTPAELQQRCRLGYRAATIHQLATGLVNGSIDVTVITDQTRSTEQLLKSYRSLPGIGPYGAAHLLAMDGRHHFIAVDSEFRRFVREQHFGGKDVSDAEMVAHYETWGRWKYLGYWCELWSSGS